MEQGVHGSHTASAAEADDADNAAFRARLCELKIWPDYDGYGFELHADVENDSKNIAKVDPGSPAEAVGLKEGDRLVEVNGVSVESEPYNEVFRRIKAAGDHISLLVVDCATEQYLRQHDVIIDGQMTQVLRVTCPDVNPAAAVATATDSGDTEPTDTAAPRARLCVLHSGHDGSVYGFTLRNDDSGSDGGRPGQFVDSVDPDSPAAAAGLRSGDRIVEVNGVNVDQLSRDEVMERINCDDGDAKDAVRLLVLDRDADDYFRAKDITVTSDMEHCVERITGPETKPEATEAHRARLCHLRMWNDGHGYGFNMQAQRGRSGHFVSDVDAGSPAEAAGLRDGDRIVAVNGDNVEQATHRDVVDNIKTLGGQVRLLVVDPDADRFFADQKITLVESMDRVERITCPETKPAAATADENGADENGADENRADENRADQNGEDQNGADQAPDDAPKPKPKPKPKPVIGYVKTVETNAAKPAEKPDKLVNVQTGGDETKQLSLDATTKEETQAPQLSNNSEPTPMSPNSTAVSNGLELAATAGEARRRMSKKKDVRSTSMSMKDKYDLFQNM